MHVPLSLGEIARIPPALVDLFSVEFFCLDSSRSAFSNHSASSLLMATLEVL
jgi:hypothetical protein